MADTDHHASAAHDAAPIEPAVLRLLAQASDAARAERLAEAQQLLADVQASLGPLAERPNWAARLGLLRAQLAYFAEDSEGSISLVQQALDTARAHGLAVEQAECAAVASLHLAYLDRNPEAVAMAGEALRCAAAQAHLPRYMALLSLANLHQSAGLNRPAFALYRRAMDHARARGDTLGVGATLVRMSHQQALDLLQLHLHGRLDREQLRQAVIGLRSSASLAEHRGPPRNGKDYMLLAELLRLQGELDEAEALLLHPSIERHPAADSPYLLARSLIERSRIQAERGLLDEAARLRDAALAALPAHTHERFSLFEALACSALARLHAELGDAVAMSACDARARAALQRHDAGTEEMAARMREWLAAAGIDDALLR